MFVFEMLAIKLGRLDDNRLDLLFTIEYKKYKREKVKGFDISCVF